MAAAPRTARGGHAPAPIDLSLLYLLPRQNARSTLGGLDPFLTPDGNPGLRFLECSVDTSKTFQPN